MSIKSARTESSRNRFANVRSIANPLLRAPTVDLLLVAGGGGGGGSVTSPGGSGAGAGGYRILTDITVNPTTYTITVGGGGTAGVTSVTAAGKGSNSSFDTTSSTGGGAGQYYLQTFEAVRHNGGSGGGAFWNSGTAGTGNSPSFSPVQGNNGGAVGTGAGQPSSGGGGANTAGVAYALGAGGNGGDGALSSYSTQQFSVTIASPGVLTLSRALSNNTCIRLTTTGALPTGLSTGTDYFVMNAGVSGTNTCQLTTALEGTAINTSGSQSGVHSLTQYFSGGGGGGAGISSTRGLGRNGGGHGGKGGNDTRTPGGAGATNTGGGGGGAGNNQSTSENGGAGGSGIVIVRHPDNYSTAVTTGSPTVLNEGNGFKYYIFTGSGSISF